MLAPKAAMHVMPWARRGRRLPLHWLVPGMRVPGRRDHCAPGEKGDGPMGCEPALRSHAGPRTSRTGRETALF